MISIDYPGGFALNTVASLPFKRLHSVQGNFEIQKFETKIVLSFSKVPIKNFSISISNIPKVILQIIQDQLSYFLWQEVA